MARDSKRIDFETWIDWKETHKMLKTRFYTNIISRHATYDIPFGNIERSCYANNSYDEAVFEVSALAEIVLSRKLTHRVVISGCKKIKAAFIKKNYPDFQIFLNAETRGLKETDIYNSVEIQAIFDEAVLSSCCGINIEYKYCTPLLVDMAKKSFLAVSVWTINDPEDMKKIIHMGVNNITTIYPDILKSVIENEKLN
jgi:glycerophosphoryl diester phosphodiesterase